MKQFETRFKQVDVLPTVKHYMSSLDLYNLFNKYVPASNSCLAEHAESLCIITANMRIFCRRYPFDQFHQRSYGDSGKLVLFKYITVIRNREKDII